MTTSSPLTHLRRFTAGLSVILACGLSAKEDRPSGTPVPAGDNLAPYPRGANADTGARSTLLKQGYDIANMDGIPRRLIAIDDVCAWPNLTRLGDGTVVAAVFNQPNHGVTAGDIDCWVSNDGGIRWSRRGPVWPHEPETTQMHVSMGLNKQGHLVAITSGWNNMRPYISHDCRTTPAIVSISTDAAKSWTRHGSVPPGDPGLSDLVPFGDIHIAKNGDLVAAMYTYELNREYYGRGGTKEHKLPRTGHVYVVRSRDDGKTWGEKTEVVKGIHVEAALIHVGDGRWLTASRRYGFLDLDLHVSVDDARTWQHLVTLTDLPRVSAAHFLKLSDGRLLLTYGQRAGDPGYGIVARISLDKGNTWEAPQRLLSLDYSDLGYPDAVEMEDGRVMVAYYTNGVAAHRRYHMGIVNVALHEFQPAAR